MGFFEGFRAAMHGQENMELFETAYQEFAESQPQGIMVTVFDGYRSFGEMPAEKMMEILPDGAMFYKFSGEEMPWREKTKILARAIDKIEKQKGAVKRQQGSPLLMPYFEWNDEEEKQRILLESLSLKAMYRMNPNLAAQIDEMGVELISDEDEKSWLIKTFIGVERSEIIDWLSIGYEHLLVQFMDISCENLTDDDLKKYLAADIQKVKIETLAEFHKAIHDTQLKLSFMAF